ncbi:hypothetical protein ACJX0J_012531, partial [Zea mays]
NISLTSHVLQAHSRSCFRVFKNSTKITYLGFWGKRLGIFLYKEGYCLNFLKKKVECNIYAFYKFSKTQLELGFGLSSKTLRNITFMLQLLLMIVFLLVYVDVPFAQDKVF